MINSKGSRWNMENRIELGKSIPLRLMDESLDLFMSRSKDQNGDSLGSGMGLGVWVETQRDG